MEIVSISLPKSVIYQLREKAKERGTSISSIVNYAVLQNLGLEEEDKEDGKLKESRGFLELTYSELSTIYRKVRNSTDLVIFLKRHLRKGILATDVIEDEVIFKTRNGLVKIPYIKFSTIEEIKTSIINLVREWKETIKKDEKRDDKKDKDIKSILDYVIKEKEGVKNGKKN